MKPDELRAIKAQKRAQAVAAQEAAAITYDGYKIQPAIGRTGGSDNVGWELIPLRVEGPTWYFATKDQCLDNIPRHTQRYGEHV